MVSRSTGNSEPGKGQRQCDYIVLSLIFRSAIRELSHENVGSSHAHLGQVVASDDTVRRSAVAESLQSLGRSNTPVSGGLGLCTGSGAPVLVHRFWCIGALKHFPRAASITVAATSYVNADGVIETIHRWDVNHDGYTDIIFALPKRIVSVDQPAFSPWTLANNEDGNTRIYPEKAATVAKSSTWTRTVSAISSSPMATTASTARFLHSRGRGRETGSVILALGELERISATMTHRYQSLEPGMSRSFCPGKRLRILTSLSNTPRTSGLPPFSPVFGPASVLKTMNRSPSSVRNDAE